jgi:hypothetical protein
VFAFNCAVRHSAWNADDSATPLSEEMMKNLGIQTSQRILTADDPLRMLVAITSMFPSLAAAIGKDEVNTTFRQELLAQEPSVPPGDDHLMVNGLAVRTCYRPQPAQLFPACALDVKVSLPLVVSCCF